MIKQLAVYSIFLITFSATAAEIDYKALYQKTSQSVVVITGGSKDVEGSSRGTGSIISSNGLVLTNSHVVTTNGQPWDNIYITLKPREVTGVLKEDFKYTFPAQFIAHDPNLDLALITFKKPLAEDEKLPFLSLSNLAKVGIGEPVVAIGHPGNGQLWSMTTGRISASWKGYNGIPGWDLFQTETAINPGNSGGPLLAGDGAIVGVNTFVIRSGKDISLEGLNYAVKSTTALTWINSLTKRPQSPPVANPSKEDPVDQKPKVTKKIVPLPKVKKSEDSYTTDKESGVVMSESDFKKEFINDMYNELNLETKEKKQAKRNLSQEPIGENKKISFDKFLNDIDY